MGFNDRDRPRSRDGGFNRDRGRSGGRSGGFGGRGGRSGGFGDRRPVEMHDAICDKCKKECQVPFKPSGGKPVLCSDCFKGTDRGSSSRSSFSPRTDRAPAGISQEQFKQINTKLDKILKVLADLEMDEEEVEEEEDEEEEVKEEKDDEKDNEEVEEEDDDDDDEVDEKKK